jgi:hypothetical protein
MFDYCRCVDMDGSLRMEAHRRVASWSARAHPSSFQKAPQCLAADAVSLMMEVLNETCFWTVSC